GAHLSPRTLIVLTSGAKVLIVTVSHTNQAQNRRSRDEQLQRYSAPQHPHGHRWNCTGSICARLRTARRLSLAQTSRVDYRTNQRSRRSYRSQKSNSIPRHCSPRAIRRISRVSACSKLRASKAWPLILCPGFVQHTRRGLTKSRAILLDT